MTGPMEILFFSDQQLSRVVKFFREIEENNNGILKSDILLALVEFAKNNKKEFEKFLKEKIPEYRAERIKEIEYLTNY
jgi:hypothetical protein